jgi:hypothetical protein
MYSYKSFDDIINDLLYDDHKIEFESVCIHYEKIFSMNCYYYKRHRYFIDINQDVDYNLLTDLVEYICETTELDVKIIDDKILPTHFYTNGHLPIGYLGRPYEREYILAQSESECKRILRLLYWLLFTKRYELSVEDRWYLKRKIWTQRVYEFENKKKIIPDYIYRFYNTILLFDKYSSKIYHLP